MKKIAPLLLAACLLHALITNSQSVWLGFKGGLSLHNLRDGDDVLSRGFTTGAGVTFGLTSGVSITHHLSLQLELYYSGQGGKRDGIQPVSGYGFPPGVLPTGYDQYYADIHKQVTFDAWQVPIMARYSWGTNIRYYVNAGFFVASLLNGDLKQSGKSLYYGDSKGQDPLVLGGGYPQVPLNFDDDLRLDRLSIVGATGGGGIAIRFNNKTELFFDVRYEYGLTNATFYGNKTTNLLFTIGHTWRLTAK